MDSIPHMKTTALPSQRPSQETARARPVYPRRRIAMKPQHLPISGLWLQATTCLAVALMVFSLSIMDFAPAKKLLQGLRYALSMESDQAVFAAERPIFSFAPMEGEGKVTENSLLYECTGLVYACGDGTVYECGQDENGCGYLRLRHNNGYESRYRGLISTAKAGDELQAGDCLGSLKEGQLLYCLYHNGRPVELN